MREQLIIEVNSRYDFRIMVYKGNTNTNHLRNNSFRKKTWFSSIKVHRQFLFFFKWPQPFERKFNPSHIDFMIRSYSFMVIFEPETASQPFKCHKFG